MDIDSNKLVNLATPTVATDASNKSYVDSKQFTVNSLTANVDGSVTLDTDDVAEGSTNLYYTDERAQDAVATALVGGTGITKTYDDAANTITHSLDFTEFDTDNVVEGSTNLYYTTTRANTDFDTRIATKSTADLSEDPSATATSGTMYFTESRARAALSIGQEPTADGDGRIAYNNTTGEFVYTPPVLAGLTGDTDDISEGSSNLYFTNERVDDRIATTIQGGSNISVTYNDSLNQLVIATITGANGYDLSANSTDDVGEGASNLYYTDERVDDRVAALIIGGTGIQTVYSDVNGDPNVDSLTISLDFSEFTTDNISEATPTPANKYFTIARAREVFTVQSGGGDGSLLYTESSGTFTYTGPSAAETRAHFAGGTGVTYTESTGTFAIGQDVATTADVDFNSVDVGGGYVASTGTGASIDAAGNISANGNLVVEGNLTVSGTQTTLTGTEVTINDEFLTLNADKTGAPAAEQVGITVERGDGANVSLKWDDSVDNWQVTNDGSTYYRLLTTNDEGTGNGLDSDTLDGEEGTHYLDYTNFTNTPTSLSDFTNDVVNDTTITFAAGTNLNIGEVDKTISTNQSGTQTITFNHDTITRTDTADTASPAFAGTFDIVDSITSSNGHITAVNVKTITLPSEANDLSSVVTWANVPDTNITSSSVTQHEGDLSILESQITFTRSLIEASDLSVGADAAASGSGGLGYNNSSGVFTYTPPVLTLSNILSNGATADANIVPDSTANNRILGSSTAIWNKIFVTNLSAGSNSTAGTIEGDWTLTTGSTLQATYADLAEIYETDQEYEVGTVVQFGGAKEITASQTYATTKIAGVISSEPAFIMNNQAPGQPVALKGRVPVKVTGTVEAGDFIVASNIPGVGIASDNYIGGAIIGKAIRSKDTAEIDLVEVKI